MILIQLLLVVAFLGFLLYVLYDPMSYHIRAWTKILAILFVLTAIISVLIPNITNSIAHIVGVTRGADLLLYLLTLAFIFAMLSSYTKEKRAQKRLVSLARKIAILEANITTGRVDHDR